MNAHNYRFGPGLPLEDAQGGRGDKAYGGQGDRIPVQYLRAVFVDKATAGLIRENLELTRLSDKGTVRSGDVFAELSRQSAAQAGFTLVFCDPPYHQGLWQRALVQIDGSDGLMAEEGILVVEHGADENDYPELSRLQLVHNRRYGHTTQISFFQWRSYMEAEEDEV